MSGSRRDRAAAVLALPGMGALARLLPRWRGVVVFNYHRVGERAGQPWDRTLWNADAPTLDLQLQTLARCAEVVTPEELPQIMHDGRPGRRVLITFDDGYRDNYEIAYPLLRKHGLRATFFLATGFLDDPRAAWWDELAWMVRRARQPSLPRSEWIEDSLALGPEQDATIATLVARYKALPSEEAERFVEYVAEASGAGRCGRDSSAEVWMTWDMVREMRSAGMQIGGHTVDHLILARVPVDRQRREIADCGARLRDELGQAMEWFAYPVGARDTFTEDTRRILREHDVRLAFSFYGGFARFATWDPLDVPRVHVGAGHDSQLMRATVWLPSLFARW